MEFELTPIETRVLGALIEKEMTTPDYYPLTLNALKAACNQKSNRFPLMELDEKTIVRNLDSLNDKGLAAQFSRPEFRVPKYQHTIRNRLNILDDRIAVLAVLMLRGPQTPGEIKNRTERLIHIDDFAEMEKILHSLLDHRQGPLVAKIERRPGQKEHRYAQLLSGSHDVNIQESDSNSDPVRVEIVAENRQIDELKAEIELLKSELAHLRSDFETFTAQFE